MRNPELQAQRERAIKDAFAALVKERKYSHEFIADQVALRYFLTANTVKRIVYGEYEANRQRKAERARLLGRAA